MLDKNKTHQKEGDYWVKKIEDIPKWDERSYREFYEYGQEFLPKLHHCDMIQNDSGRYDTTLRMEFIDGKPLTIKNYNIALQYVCYKIVPAFFRYSMSDVAGISHQELIDGFLRQQRNTRLYFHGDLRFKNFLITEKNRLYLMDIDGLEWTSGLPDLNELFLNVERSNPVDGKSI